MSLLHILLLISFKTWIWQTFAVIIVTCDEVTFHLLENVNWHNLRIWPHQVTGHTSASPKLNLSCALCVNKKCCDAFSAFRHFFFAEHTMTGIVCLEMLFQLDRTPPHFHKEMTYFLKCKFSGKWIGRGGHITLPLCPPDPAPLDSFFWEYINDNVYMPPPATT
jgi:hypothetical protein